MFNSGRCKIPINSPCNVLDTRMASVSEHEWRYDCSSQTEYTNEVDGYPLWEFAPEYVQLSCWDPRYRDIATAFVAGWTHEHKRAEIVAIYHVIESAFQQWPHGQRFQRYLTHHYGWLSPKLKFHGTLRACSFGNPDSIQGLVPCDLENCQFCCILYRGFRLENARFGGMFGRGIYSSDSSSKADHYVKNLVHLPLLEPPGTLRAVLVCRVVCDKPQRLVGPEYQRTRPDNGFNCVEALTTAEGGTVRYPETIVYREDAMAPVAIVIYTKIYQKKKQVV